MYNPVQHLFYAAVGFQGIYSSSNGGNWSRLASQPGPGLSLLNCPADFSTTCPMFRGALTIRPGADEMYAWYVDLNSNDQGIYKTTDGGQTWITLDESGITTCGDAAGCGTEQGFFNLVLSAVPESSGGTGDASFLGTHIFSRLGALPLGAFWAIWAHSGAIVQSIVQRFFDATLDHITS